MAPRYAWARILGPVLLASGLLALAGTVATRATPAGTVSLRVIGASNRRSAQALKLRVRDAVLALLAPQLVHADSAAAASAVVAARLPDVRRVASTVAAAGGEAATVRWGPATLPARQIGWLRFPAARSPALVITLGAGRGHNWWTVLFPPLAFVTLHGTLAVVGPAGAAVPVRDLTGAQRRALLAWVSGRTRVALDPAVAPLGPGGPTGVRVQVRFALWDLLRRVPWPAIGHDIHAWLPGLLA